MEDSVKTAMFSPFETAAFAALRHTSYGLYIWELVCSARFDWTIVTARRPWRWCMVAYFLARYLGLAAVVGQFLFLFPSSDTDCPVLAKATLALILASFIWAVWMALINAAGLWEQKLTRSVPMLVVLAIAGITNTGASIYGIVGIDGEPSETTNACCLRTKAGSVAAQVTAGVCLVTILLAFLSIALWAFKYGSRPDAKPLKVTRKLAFLGMGLLAFVPSIALLAVNRSDGANAALVPLAHLLFVIFTSRMHQDWIRYVQRDMVKPKGCNCQGDTFSRSSTYPYHFPSRSTTSVDKPELEPRVWGCSPVTSSPSKLKQISSLSSSAGMHDIELGGVTRMDSDMSRLALPTQAVVNTDPFVNRKPTESEIDLSSRGSDWASGVLSSYSPSPTPRPK